jgi:hypothetical protein
MSLQEKKLAIHMKIENFYRRLHCGELDNLYQLIRALEDLVEQAKVIAANSSETPSA